MSHHAIDGSELAAALAQYVIKRDGLEQEQAHRVQVVARCDILHIGAPGPLFVLELTAVPMSRGGSS